MIFRVFLVIVAIIALALIGDSVRLVWVKQAVYKTDPAYVTGNEDAPLSIVEFVDYSCFKCHKTYPAFEAALLSEDNIYYLPRPLSDTEEGKMAARFVYAAGRQGFFFNAHNKLMEGPETIDMAYLERIAGELDLDFETIKKDMDDPKIIKLVEKNGKYNEGLGSYTIPTYFINGKVLWIVDKDIPTAQDFKTMFEQIKANTNREDG